MSSRHAALLALGLAASLFIAMGPADAAAAPYWRCESGRVSVVSNSSATRCELLLRATLRYEQLFSELVGMQLDESLTPLRLYSLTRVDAREYMFTEKELGDQVRTRQAIHSRSMPGLELNVLSIVDLGGDEPLQSALNLYSQMLMSNGPARGYPAWYQLGVATLLNGLMIRPDGMVILSRTPAFLAVAGDHARASADVRVDLPALLDAKPSGLPPADYNEFSRRAHVWAQFGMLTTPERRKQYHDLADLMRQGTPAEEAVPAAFGISLKELTGQFEGGAWRKDVSFRVPAPGSAPTFATPLELDAAGVDEQFTLLKQRVAEFGAR